MSTPVLSIITVCFNACNELQNTVKNVLAQEWTNFEYLVIDGASTDDTVSFLEPLFLQQKKFPSILFLKKITESMMP